jgi:ATP-binding cassette, subfamily C, bacterial LapB
MTLSQEKKLNGFDNAPPFKGNIGLNNVSVTRGSSGHAVLRNITLDIKAGQIVAVTGRVGGGKSAFLDLIGGLSQPSEGSILYDDIDSREMDMAKFRSKIGFARQNATMFRGTILDNLTKFRGREYLAPALDIARQIGLDEDIALMPKGLMTPVGDSASGLLSASIQQEIAIASVLADEPALFLFNEANTALDMNTDQRLKSMFINMRGHTTIIMITSRPSLIAIADIVLEANGGKITHTSNNNDPVRGIQ